MIRRLYVEKKKEYAAAADRLLGEINGALKINATALRDVICYDIDNISDADFAIAVHTVFSEPPVDDVWFETLKTDPKCFVFCMTPLPGQYDQRADSAAQCVQLFTQKQRPQIRCSRVIVLSGVSNADLERVKNYLINPIENIEIPLPLRKPDSLAAEVFAPEETEIIDGFTGWSKNKLSDYFSGLGFAMSYDDLLFVQGYFNGEKRDPTLTELKVIDTYWSDHCRHTTFLTELKDIKIESENPHIAAAFKEYEGLHDKLNGGRADKYKCLMDIATIAVKKLKADGLLDNLDESDEINACSIRVNALVSGKSEKWLVMFKNETHNHPTEIEPFGGAATCLGGAIRDPLSGRVYVYQAMRVSGAADITKDTDTTLNGKLPQRYISSEAARGYSAYGNQIGLATGMVTELYHPNYVAKRLETGFVIGAAPEKNVIRKPPTAGDVIILLGGETGRDGCGGATGSSKAHTEHSIETCAAEVQKGNPLTERKIQRLFRNEAAARLIKKCNDFGSGGVCVAIGELSGGVEIDLSLIPKKYEGLSATELAISESQERMAVVLAADNVQKFIELAASENLSATTVAGVTDKNRMKMFHEGKTVVDIDRDFLNTNGVKQTANAHIIEQKTEFFNVVFESTQKYLDAGDYKNAALNELKRLAVASQRGMGTMFDGTVGAGSVYMPFGGKTELTPALTMAAKLPVLNKKTDTCSVVSFGCNPRLTTDSPFVGAVYSVVASLSKLAASGARALNARLTLQEYFKRLGADPLRWGQPLSALLGATYAQLNLNVAAIGGKDSMSGTFLDIDVPPTLISFAVAVEDANTLICNVLKAEHKNLYRLSLRRDGFGMPDFGHLKGLYEAVHKNIASKNISFATVVDEGGAAVALIKSCLGDRIGLELFKADKNIFLPLIGDIIIACTDKTVERLSPFAPELIAKTTKQQAIVIGKQTVTIDEAADAFTGTLENVFPTHTAASEAVSNISYGGGRVLSCAKPSFKTASPRVFIPAFPGTNCEYDTAKQFLEAGAKPIIYVMKNRSVGDIEQSVKEMSALIKGCQMIAIPGGFSGGDEPDGSGKFIATVCKNPRISDAVADLLKNRDGLMLGICNGFQALIKLGLVPFGEISPLKENSPTLTYNKISRHVSSIINIRVASTKSPWLFGTGLNEIYSQPVSHGEGRFVCNDDLFKTLKANGQIAAQYVDDYGNAASEYPFNPNGSYYAVEALTSPDGRILGKMGHSERIGGKLYKNREGNYDMKIFESGVDYFK